MRYFSISHAPTLILKTACDGLLCVKFKRIKYTLIHVFLDCSQNFMKEYHRVYLNEAKAWKKFRSVHMV